MSVTPINGGSRPPDDPYDINKIPPTWQPTTPFPEAATAPVLRKSRIRKSQFRKWSNEYLLFLAAHLGGDLAIVLQKKVRDGDKDTIKLLTQMLRLVDKEGGINIQTNIGINNASGGRQIDSLIRRLDERDRNSTVIDSPVAVEDKEFDTEDEEE